MLNEYLLISDFDLTKAKSKGGQTGSMQVPGMENLGNALYQLKKSVLDAALTRKLKAGSLDTENFGEVISASVCRSITGSGEVGETELAPEVSLVYDNKEGKVLVASKYLQNVEGGTLDDFYKSRIAQDAPHNLKHAKISLIAGEDGPGILNISGSEFDLLRKDLAKAIALSALSGDHDVNPGNMIVKRDAKNNLRVAGIDHGHAFNDLRRHPNLGGAILNPDNMVVDFLNRATVDNFPKGGQSKLWRDYSGLVPSQELADALKEVGNSRKMPEGISNTWKSYQKLVDDIQRDSVQNPKHAKKNAETLEHIKKSLIQISDRVTDEKIDKTSNIKTALTQTFTNLTTFYDKGQKQMLDVAKLMDTQVKIDQLIKNQLSHTPSDDLIKTIQQQYDDLKQAQGIGNRNQTGIEWVKSNANTPAFKGSLEEFIAKRANELSKNQDSSLTPEQIVHSIQERFGRVNVPIGIKHNPDFADTIREALERGVAQRPRANALSPTNTKLVTDIEQRPRANALSTGKSPHNSSRSL